MHAQIVQLMLLIQQLGKPLWGDTPLEIRITAWDLVNLLPQTYVVRMGDIEQAATSATALFDALVLLLVEVYKRTYLPSVLPSIQANARQFSAVAALGY